MSSSSVTATVRSWVWRFGSGAADPARMRRSRTSWPLEAPKCTLPTTEPKPSGWYHCGDVHARSWIVFGHVGLQHVANWAGTFAGTEQSTPAALQTYVLQRHVGFSRTRA